MMKAGFCETDITPALGMERPGGYGKAYAAEIHDPLKVRAGVFDDGKQRVALVGVDTCVISARAVSETRREIRRRCGIPEDHVLVGASHTHTGGPLFGFLPDEFDDAPQFVRELALNHTTVVDPAYHHWAVRQIVTAVCEADRKKEKALLSVGKGFEGRAVFNRRFRMKNGRVYTHPGKGNPDILEPAGPIDPEVGVLAAWTAGGDLLGCVVNYACHGTTSQGGGISADWICFMEKTVKGVMGNQAVSVFLNGASGDVTQVDNQSLGEREFGEKSARLVGTRVGAEALKVLVTAERGVLRPVRAAARILRMKRRQPGKERLKKSREILKRSRGKAKKTTEWTFAKELLLLDYLLKKEPVAAVEIQGIQIGPAIFLANPAELFCRLGLDIKNGSPFSLTFVVELANGSVGYVPTEEAFAPSGGGYETVLTSYSNLEPAAGTKIVDACCRLAKQFKPGRIPKSAGLKRTGALPLARPWSYGVLGPDLE